MDGSPRWTSRRCSAGSSASAGYLQNHREHSTSPRTLVGGAVVGVADALAPIGRQPESWFGTTTSFRRGSAATCFEVRGQRCVQRRRLRLLGAFLVCESVGPAQVDHIDGGRYVGLEAPRQRRGATPLDRPARRPHKDSVLSSSVDAAPRSAGHGGGAAAALLVPTASGGGTDPMLTAREWSSPVVSNQRPIQPVLTGAVGEHLADIPRPEVAVVELRVPDPSNDCRRSSEPSCAD